MNKEEKKQSKDLKPAYVVMLLEKENEERESDLKAQGVKAFIVKPFSPKEILDQVDSLLSSKGKSPIKEKKVTISSDKLRISNNGLDILETSDLLEDYEQSIPDSQKAGVHGFDWYLSELQKEIKDEDKPELKVKGEGFGGERKTPLKPEETFVKYQPTEPPGGEKQEKDNLSFEGEAPENFIEDLRRELEELGSEEEIETKPEAVETINPAQLDQMLSDLRSRISERVAQEVAKMISPEFLERIIREEIAQLKECSCEKKSSIKEDIPT